MVGAVLQRVRTAQGLSNCTHPFAVESHRSAVDIFRPVRGFVRRVDDFFVSSFSETYPVQLTITSTFLGLCLSVLPLTALKAQCTSFVPGPNSATLLGNVTLDGAPASAEDELAAYDLQGVCLGKAVVVEADGLAFFSLVVYGDDPTTMEDEGLMAGDDFVLELHDVSTGEVILYSAAPPFSGWTNTNGAPLMGWDDPYQTLNFSDPNTCVGDFDGSGAVEVADLLDLLSTFGNECAECATDLDGDGSVQVSDLLNLLSVFGTAC